MSRRKPTTSFVHMALRGVVGKCPRCGDRGWFRHWFRKNERCRTCGYKFERQDGFMLGAMTMNIIITFFLLAMVIVIGTVATYPDIAAVKMVAIGVAVAALWPVLFYPMSYTLWGAVDLLMHPLEAEQAADADAHADPQWRARWRPADA